MPDYSKGKIYTIRCHNDNSLIYVGSTIQPLNKRWGGHKAASRLHPHFSLYQAIDNSFENWFIELHEDFPCENKEQLFKREGEVIREIGNLNGRISGRTRKEYREDNSDTFKERSKIYYQENIDKFKLYRQENSEKIKEYTKQYRQNNAEKLRERDKIYRQNNAEKLKEKYRERIHCECGAIISKRDLTKHKKTQKHIILMKKID